MKTQTQIQEEARKITNESLKLICAGVLRRTTLDGKSKRHKKDIRDFLNSKWGQSICEGLELTMKMCDKVDVRVDAKEVLDSIESGKANFGYIKSIEEER